MLSIKKAKIFIGNQRFTVRTTMGRPHGVLDSRSLISHFFFHHFFLCVFASWLLLSFTVQKVLFQNQSWLALQCCQLSWAFLWWQPARGKRPTSHHVPHLFLFIFVVGINVYSKVCSVYSTVLCTHQLLCHLVIFPSPRLSILHHR